MIAGEIPVMNLDGWTWEENTLRPSAGLAMTFPGGGGGGRGGGGGGGGAGGGGAGDQARQLDELNRMLDQTRAYMKNANRTASVNWTLEPFVPILERQQAFYVNAGTEQAIRDAIAWAEKQNINIVMRISPNSQAHGAVPESAQRAGHSRQRPVDAVERGPLPRLHVPDGRRPREGGRAVRVFERRLQQRATDSLPGRDVGRLGPRPRRGDPGADASTRRRIFGVDSQIGTLEAGKLANLVVVRGDPLEIRSQIKHVVIAGHDIPLDSKHTDLFKRYMSRQ